MPIPDKRQNRRGLSALGPVSAPKSALGFHPWRALPSAPVEISLAGTALALAGLAVPSNLVVVGREI